MGLRAMHWATGIWLLVCAVLAAIVALELSSPITPWVSAALPGAALPEVAPEPDPFAPPPRDAFAEITARPLFAPSRRPLVPATEAVQVAPEEVVAVELVGTLLSDRGWVALLQTQGQNARWLRAGERITGWQVETIARRQVRLRRNDEPKVLQLRADFSRPTPSPDAARAQSTATGVARERGEHEFQEATDGEKQEPE